MNKTIGILAHVDAGKTTFAEQILYHTKSIRSRGRVDHKNSFLDSNNIEKERGITIFSDQAIFQYNDSTYYLIDTPGHSDFSSEMERAIKIMDYAIIIVSAVDGIQAQTEVIWELIKKHSIPTFFFINKTDRESANVEGVVREIGLTFTSDIIYLQDSFTKDSLSSEIIEYTAERDEVLLEKYLNGDYEKDLWIIAMKKMIKENKIYHCFSGSALQDIGIENFLEKLDLLTFTEYEADKNFSGLIYKIRHDENRNRLIYIKALQGTLNVRDEICVESKGGKIQEKISSIRLYNGNKYKAVDKVSAGEVFAVAGLSRASIGQVIGENAGSISYEMIPALKSRVIYDNNLNPKEILSYFKILECEDPTLNVLWNEKLQEIEIHIMGTIQLEILKQLVHERFNLTIEFGPCEILYKETILETVMGYGHFEPLKHYAEVNLKLEPAPRNSGITFENLCSTEDLSKGNQNLVKTHIFEKEHKGILTGSPVTDIKVSLITGRAHIKHTSGGDFREATLRALRQGLEKTKNVLLEPYYRFKIEVETEYMGRIISDIQKLNGTFEDPKVLMDKVIIKGRGPVATFMNYSVDLTALTKGKGKIIFNFDGYDICHNEDEIIEKIRYDKDADIEYTSTSVFCSKGQAFLVKWDNAEEYMHCIK